MRRVRFTVMTPYFVKMAAFVFPSWSANWKGGTSMKFWKSPLTGSRPTCWSENGPTFTAAVSKYVSCVKFWKLVVNCQLSATAACHADSEVKVV